MPLLTLLALALAPCAAAFVTNMPARPARAPHCAGARLRPPPVMLASVQEVFGQLYERSPPVQKSLQSIPPPVAKAAPMGLVGIAAATGFFLTPSRRLAVNAVGGALSGGLGAVARKRLAGERQKAAVPAVAALLSQGLQKADAASLAAIAEQYGVPKKEFSAQLSELYLAFLNACLLSSAVETAELSELLRLQKTMRLSAQQVGAQVHSAGKQLFYRHRAYLEESEPNASKKLLEKFVFLAERILVADESEEGYRYQPRTNHPRPHCRAHPPKPRLSGRPPVSPIPVCEYTGGRRARAARMPEQAVRSGTPSICLSMPPHKMQFFMWESIEYPSNNRVRASSVRSSASSRSLGVKSCSGK